jgi:D-arabinose 1-dehydrogenase-like Zn-dependent alcohol dehydrogenase
MSKVVKFYEFGEPEVFKLEEEPLREPQAMVNEAGVTSIAITRKLDKREGLIQAGAHHVIVTDEEDMAQRVNAIADGKGANIVFDPVWTLSRKIGRHYMESNEQIGKIVVTV